MDINKLTESDKGREVKYKTPGGTEWGLITSWNERFVFVRYHTRLLDEPNPVTGHPIIFHRNGCTSEATRPEDLEFCD